MLAPPTSPAPPSPEALRAALLASEARYRALYESNPVMFFTLAEDGTVLSVNRFGASELGHAPEDLIGRSVLDVFHPDDKPAVAAGLNVHLARPDGEVSRWEFRKVRSTGEVIWVREAVTTTTDPSGRRVVLVVCDNITKWKAAETELALTKERLVLMERMAAMGTLVSGVAHEIRTPLTIIQTNASLLELRASRLAQHPDTAPLVALVDGISDGVTRIAGLVSDLRRFTNARPLAETRTTLDAAVGSGVALFRHTHPALPRFEVDLQPTPEIIAASLQIEQVVVNLLQNAVEAVQDKDQGRVSIRTRASASGAVLIVEDNGEGVPVEARGRIFEPLFTTKPDGSGLGLAIVERIVHRHRGSIHWETGPAGTRFEITLPAAPPAPAPGSATPT